MNKAAPSPLFAAVDLFCGVGGLTKGLDRAGIETRLGIDFDPHCKYPYSHNNKAGFALKSVDDVTGQELKRALRGADFTLLAGCAPCQPFSTYTRGQPVDKRWELLGQFGRLWKFRRHEVDEWVTSGEGNYHPQGKGDG